jgi:vacuolar-type H+-ATPase subunit E/Vma4
VKRFRPLQKNISVTVQGQSCVENHASPRKHTILEQENADQKALLQARKRNLSGKTRVIDGKYLMTGAELIGVREAEEATKPIRVPKKGARKQKGKSKAKKESK